MDEYIRQLQAYVREYKIIFEEDCPQPCLDALWWHYGEYHNMDSPQTKEGFKNLRACLDSLPVEDSDAVFEDVVCLCAEYERIRDSDFVGIQAVGRVTDALCRVYGDWCVFGHGDHSFLSFSCLANHPAQSVQ